MGTEHTDRPGGAEPERPPDLPDIGKPEHRGAPLPPHGAPDGAPGPPPDGPAPQSRPREASVQ